MAKLEITFPLYGDQEMFVRALVALKNQSFKDFHITAIDDFSPVGFETEINKFKELSIDLIRNTENLGAMNNIWKSINLKTDSTYLMSHHADDFLKADYLEKAITILENNSDISFVVTGPEWVSVNKLYEKVEIQGFKYDIFDAADFVKNILEFSPYMFGSVIYRTKHRTNNWKYDELHVFCDRHYLADILYSNDSKGAYLYGNGIFERNHNSDKDDNRGNGSSEENALNLMVFYKKILSTKYSPNFVSKIITNNTIYYYSNFKPRTSLFSFLKKAIKQDLVQLRSLRTLGIMSLLTLPFTLKTKVKLARLFKK
jgi:hypothetical protein